MNTWNLKGYDQIEAVGDRKSYDSLDEIQKLERHRIALELLTFEIQRTEKDLSLHVGHETDLAIQLCEEFESQLDYFQEQLKLVSESLDTLKSSMPVLENI